MKIQIRKGTFETNSSSTHSITMCKKENYDKFLAGEMLVHKEVDIVTREEAIAELKNDRWYQNADWDDEELVDEILKENQYFTFDQWDEYCYYMEQFNDEYETESGETIVAFGYYGYD